jgi:hypothetical protein
MVYSQYSVASNILFLSTSMPVNYKIIVNLSMQMKSHKHIKNICSLFLKLSRDRLTIFQSFKVIERYFFK